MTRVIVEIKTYTEEQEQQFYEVAQNLDKQVYKIWNALNLLHYYSGVIQLPASVHILLNLQV